MLGGWRHGIKPKPAVQPDTPGVNLGLDEPDFKFPTRMMENVTDVVLSKYSWSTCYLQLQYSSCELQPYFI